MHQEQFDLVGLRAPAGQLEAAPCSTTPHALSCSRSLALCGCACLLRVLLPWSPLARNHARTFSNDVTLYANAWRSLEHGRHSGNLGPLAVASVGSEAICVAGTADDSADGSGGF